MNELTLTLTDMAHGGLALGRDKAGRPVFVPFAIPGEIVRVRLPDDAGRFARAELIEVIEPSNERVTPACPHFGICGNCHLQHMSYSAQLRAKESAVRDQLTRVGRLRNPAIRPIIPSPHPYEYRTETALFPTATGGLGYWSPIEKRIFQVDTCPVLHPRLQQTLADLDIDLPGLRKVTLRLGDDEEILAGLEIDGVEPPDLEVDFPVSVAIVLPDRTAAALIGDRYLVVTLGGRAFRVSPGVGYPLNPAATELVIQTVLELVDIGQDTRVVEVTCGAGILTAALAGRAAEVIAIEPNPDAVLDAVENLDSFDNVTIYEAEPDDVLPRLDVPDLFILRDEGHISPGVLKWVGKARPKQVVAIGEVGIIAKDTRLLSNHGYKLKIAVPVDEKPQSFEVKLVSIWTAG